MKPLEELYPASFFARRNKLAWRANCLGPIIVRTFNPRTLIDVGCGIGDFVAWFRLHHIDACGIEGSTAAKPYSVCPAHITYWDLRKALPDNTMPYDLAISVEVAEHIEEPYADTFVQNITRLAPCIMLTIAGPGQKGHHHVNLQPRSYWDALFARYAFYPNTDLIESIRQQMRPLCTDRRIYALAQNLVIYEKRTPL